jgi:hypothetical protein
LLSTDSYAGHGPDADDGKKGRDNFAEEPTMTSTTYRAVHVTAPGRLELVERELVAPPPGKVRIRIGACGVCHTDAFTVEGLDPGVAYPG